jgi:hypothetical protein
MPIFSLAPMLATILNRHSSVASSTVASSPLFPASFSLSALMISPASTVRLYDVSISSILARNSRICLSTTGSGILLSLLLDEMAEIFSSFLFATKSKEFFLGSDTTIGADP